VRIFAGGRRADVNVATSEMRMIRLLAPFFLLASMGAALAQPCGERVAFVRSVIDKDLKVGFIGKNVYTAMTQDLDSALEICRFPPESGNART